ncbi:MAG: Zn-ribbon domain-containing OB-fold protein [Thermoplasmata archaeon]|nr:Zn-ribbon domain-containing OB-fold protein [Thermoplasmata archaeon]
MPKIDLPYLLDFCPLQTEDFTRIHEFFTNLKEGKFTTTKCKSCGEILWQPRVVCPHCNSDEMEWIDLPQEGKLFAFTEVIHGAPLGMEDDAPFSIGIVDLEDPKMKVLARVDDAHYEDLEFGQEMRLKIITLEDGRVWFRWVRK